MMSDLGDVRWGSGWYAFVREGVISVCASRRPDSGEYHRRFATIYHWDDLPKALYEFGFIPEMEYLAQALEPSFSEELP